LILGPYALTDILLASANATNSSQEVWSPVLLRVHQLPNSPNANKRPGVCYAVTRDGVELPVVDVTHPAFAISIRDAEQKAQVEKFLRQGIPLAILPKRLRELVLRSLLRESVLAQGIQQARSNFMSGMHTYLLKLGPEMLGSAYTKPIDRRGPALVLCSPPPAGHSSAPGRHPAPSPAQ
jgi:hypothetical protein